MRNPWFVAVLLAVACDRRGPPPKPDPVVPDPKAAAAAYDARDWPRCEALWLALAATTRGEAAASPLYNAACCQALGGKRDAAFATLERAVTSGLVDLAHVLEDPDLAALHADPRWAATTTAILERVTAAARAVGDPALRTELLALMAEDQAVRRSVMKAGEVPDGADRIAAIDRKTAARMKEIVAAYGWPGKSLVGKDGASAAWLLVQHADHDVAFQRACLERLEVAVAQGEAEAVDHAFLYDRVAVNTGKPQRYGTQFHDGAAFPIEDEAHVDDRRRALGMPTMAEYQKQLRDAYDPD